MTDGKTDGTATERLEHQQLITELVRHVLAASRPKQPSRPYWQVFLESAGGTALISVMLGGVVAASVGQYLTYRYQQLLRSREIATTSYESYLRRSDASITTAFSLIGEVMSASENLMTLAHPGWNPERYPKSERAEVVAHRDEIVGAFTRAYAHWMKDKDQQALMIQYYHDADPEIAARWKSLQDSVSEYADCAYRLFWLRGTKETSSLWIEACIGERQNVSTNIERFLQARLKTAARKASVMAQDN